MLEDVRFGEGQEIVSYSDILKAVVEGNLIQHRQSVAIQSLVKCFENKHLQSSVHGSIHPIEVLFESPL